LIDLILKDIQDPHVRENFFRISRFLNNQIFFEGDFKLFDVTLLEANDFYPIKHGLTFTPEDIILLAVEGDFNLFFRYSDFDKDFIYVNNNGPARIRFLAGKLKDKVRNRLATETLPLVEPGDIASPGFVFGAVGDKTPGFWLTGEGIPSNIVGVPVLFGDGLVVKIAVGTEIDVAFTVGIYQHEGNGVGLIELGQSSFVIAGARRQLLNLPIQYVSQNVQLAVRLLSGNTRNLKVSLVLKGSGI
jgi:hypothetical protein